MEEESMGVVSQGLGSGAGAARRPELCAAPWRSPLRPQLPWVRLPSPRSYTPLLHHLLPVPSPSSRPHPLPLRPPPRASPAPVKGRRSVRAQKFGAGLGRRATSHGSLPSSPPESTHLRPPHLLVRDAAGRAFTEPASLVPFPSLVKTPCH